MKPNTLPASEHTDKPKPKCRWFQFSLRTLLVFMVLVAMGLSWFAVKMQQAREQRLAVEAIRKLGAAVSYDTEISAMPAPGWLRGLLGEDIFGHIVAVVGGPQITDAGLEHLKGLSQLRDLHLPGTKVTDDGLEKLKGLNQLQWLALGGTQVTDEGVEKLQQALPNCKIQR